MTEVVAGAAAAERRSVAAAVDFGGIVDVGRSGGYRQSRRIGTEGPGSGSGSGSGFGAGDRHLWNTA
jgi:hypothetical protein